jgi:hypothetical protein
VSELAAGTAVAGFRIESLIGHGSSGSVYLRCSGYGLEPWLIHLRKRSTCSAGHGLSQGMLPSASLS